MNCYDQGDIILTTVENEATVDEQINGDVFPSANELRTTQHEVGTQGGTKSGLNFNYNLIENKDIPASEITQFVNIINHVEIQQEKEEIESVISETPNEKDVFGSVNYLNYKSGHMEEVYYDNNIKYDISKVGLGKSYISGASCYPPRLTTSCTIGAFHEDLGTCTNVSIEDRVIGHDWNDHEIVEIEEQNEGVEKPIFISDTNCEIIDNKDDTIIITIVSFMVLMQLNSLRMKLNMYVLVMKLLYKIKQTNGMFMYQLRMVMDKLFGFIYLQIQEQM